MPEKAEETVIDYVYKKQDPRTASVVHYLKNKERQLESAIANRKKIYVDINFLVDIADWSLGRS